MGVAMGWWLGRYILGVEKSSWERLGSYQRTLHLSPPYSGTRRSFSDKMAWENVAAHEVICGGSCIHNQRDVEPR